MNIVLPVDYQSFSPPLDGLGTADLQAQNNTRHAISPIQNLAQAKQANQESGSYNNPSKPSSEHNNRYQDTVSISPEGKQAADAQVSTSLSDDDKSKVQELKDRDREVRVHEQAHAAVGGQYAGAPSYEYETGPDGKRYAIAGEVSIDVSEEQKPEDTIQKMQIVRAAALAPAEPSSQDLKVAADASQKENQARAELGQQQLNTSSADGQAKTSTINSKLQAYQDNDFASTISRFSVSA